MQTQYGNEDQYLYWDSEMDIIPHQTSNWYFKKSLIAQSLSKNQSLAIAPEYWKKKSVFVLLYLILWISLKYFVKDRRGVAEVT